MTSVQEGIAYDAGELTGNQDLHRRRVTQAVAILKSRERFCVQGILETKLKYSSGRRIM